MDPTLYPTRDPRALRRSLARFAVLAAMGPGLDYERAGRGEQTSGEDLLTSERGGISGDDQLGELND